MFYLKLNVILRRHLYTTTKTKTTEKPFSYNDLIDILKSKKKEKLEKEKNTLNIDESKILVISNGSCGYNKSILININEKKYLFNCGESTYRNLIELGIVLTHDITNLFVTRKSWSTIGGLVSLFNSKRNGGFKIHAPFNVMKFFETAYFNLLRLSDVKAQTHDHNLSEFEDEFFTIKAIEVKEIKSTTSKLDSQETDKEDDNDLNDNKKKFNEVQKIYQDFLTPKDNTVYAYMCNFKVSRAKIIVLDCPSENFIDSVIKNEAFIGTDIQYLIHMGPNNVLNNPDYKKWIDSNKQIIHLILNETLTESHSKNNLLMKLNLTDPEIYGVKPNQLEVENLNNEKHIKYCFHGTIAELQYDIVKNFKRYNSEKSPSLALMTLDKDKDVYPKIVILGTSSAAINLHRNSSCYLVYLNENSSILMDCGEGSLGQIIRHFGENNYRNEVKKIKAIYISHAHGDHQLGLMSVLNERKKIDHQSLLYLCIPDNLNMILHPLQLLFKDKKVFKNVKILLNEWFIKENIAYLRESLDKCEEKNENKSSKLPNKYKENFKIIESVNDFKNYVDVEIFETLLVNHIPYSSGLYIKFKNQFTFGYSGDCRPTKQFTDLIKNCDLLINEATFSNDHSAIAKVLFHSTVNEAVNVAKEANVKYLILTHFGKFLSKQTHEIFYDETQFNNVGIAVDHMEVNRLNINKIPNYNHIFREKN
jgi:ribonuclease Z